MTGAIKDNLDHLKKVQEVDREIYQISLSLEEIPATCVKIKQDLENEKAHLKALEAAFRKLQLTQKEKEGVLAQKEAHVKKLDGQLSQVKTNKEYSALQQEIASLKADNSLLEEDIIRIIDEVEAAEEEVKEEGGRVKQIEKDYTGRESELSQQEKTLREKLQSFKKTREEFMTHVPPDIRSMYDLIIQKKQGLALVPVNGEICGACQLKLRPQLINEIRLGAALVACENCARILYFEE